MGVIMSQISSAILGSDGSEVNGLVADDDLVRVVGPGDHLEAVVCRLQGKS